MIRHPDLTTRRLVRMLALVLLAVVLLAASPARATAQEMSLPSVKAAFLVNFAKFAEWPEGSRAAGQLFTFCVAGDRTVFEALDGMVKPVAGRHIGAAAYVPAGGPFHECHLLYLGGLDSSEWRAAIQSLHTAAVFTVGDARGFAEAGGIAELKLENGKMRFSINAAAARRGNIALSAKLLSLATLVKEKSHDGR